MSAPHENGNGQTENEGRAQLTCAKHRTKVKNASAWALLEYGSGARMGNCVPIQTMPNPTPSGICEPMYTERLVSSFKIVMMPNPSTVNAQPTQFCGR